MQDGDQYEYGWEGSEEAAKEWHIRDGDEVNDGK
jgi:hypothetical protein